MDQQQQQHQQEQQGAASHMSSMNGNGNGNGGASSSQQTQEQAQALPPHLMGLMTNPAFAAAAVASPLFPPAAMLSNPGAYLSMPDVFAAAATAAGAASSAGLQPQSGAQPQQQTHPQQSLDTNNNSISSNQHHQSQQHAMLLPNNIPIAPMQPGLNQQQQLLQQQQHSNPYSTQQHPQLAHLQPARPLQQQHQHMSGTLLPSLNVASSSGPSASSAAAIAAMHLQHQAEDDQAAAVAAAGRDMTPEERAQQNRDRNREHARSTRLRKKAYVAKLKELVETLHVERTEEVRQRRVAIQHLAEMQTVRRAVVRKFLQYHSTYEADERKWVTLLEDKFWLKQPVTPYRSFRRAEIEKDCHVSRGLQAVICDAASLSVMIEGIGSRSPRWMQIKREEFMLLEEAQRGTKNMPRCIVRQESRLQHAMSSLSSSSGSSNHGSSGEENVQGNSAKRKQPKLGINLGGGSAGVQTSEDGSKLQHHTGMNANAASGSGSGSGGSANGAAQKVSSGSSNDSRHNKASAAPKDFHDYHAQPLPDPKLGDFERSSTSADDSPEESNSSSHGDTKRITTDSSSGDDSAGGNSRSGKRRKVEEMNATSAGEAAKAAISKKYSPPPIAKKGGIPHNIQPVAATGNGTAGLGRAPAIHLPPFAGIGKRAAQNCNVAVGAAHLPVPLPAVNIPGNRGTSNSLGNGPAVISADVETSSSSSVAKTGSQIRAHFHINEDDMILLDDILMCPFTFRSQDAVLCGALAECVMPGMLRAHFSTRNKLNSLEFVYDAMGFMQQLERASGNEGTAQIVPGSLEMALAPSTSEARVITLAKSPFLIVNVNDVWTQTTGYTQMEVEGKEYLPLLEGEGTVRAASERPGKPLYKLDEVAQGRPACMTNIHYDKNGNDFIEFVCSYPLTK